eukprot:g3253.t1
MNSTSPALAPPAAPQDEEDLFALSIIDWDIGAVDQNCRKLLRVLAGVEDTYAGTSNDTPGGRAHLKKQLDKLQREKAEYREKREALILRLSRRPAYASALAAGDRIDEGEQETASDEDDVRITPLADFLRFPATGGAGEEAIMTLPEPSAPRATAVGGLVPPGATVALEPSTPSAAVVQQAAPIGGDAGDGTLFHATTVGSRPILASWSSSCASSVAAEVSGTAGDAATAAVVAERVAAEAVSTSEAEDPAAASSEAMEHVVSPTPLSLASPSSLPVTSPGNAETPVAEAAEAEAAVEAQEELVAAAECSQFEPAPTMEKSSAQSWASDLKIGNPTSSSILAPSRFWGRAIGQDVRKPVTHEVQVRATVGARGLGLVLAEEQEGSQWVVKGFRPMPGGKPNPGQAAGIKAGDKLQQLGGVHLGSYRDGIELLKQQRGPVFITVRRQIF